jgi:hypothetical protein
MKKFNSIYTAVKGAGLVGLLAAGSSAAMAETFDATATVQNTLAVTKVNDLNLGTIFASVASASASFVTLAADNTYGTVQRQTTNGTPNIVMLGGQQVAQASIDVTTTAAITVQMPKALSTGALTIGNLNASAVETGGLAQRITDGKVVELRIGGTGGDPTVARFYLTNFQLGEETGATKTSCNTLNAGSNVTCILSPTFGSNSVGFNVGATLLTDWSGTRTAYQAGTYSGSFAITASY